MSATNEEIVISDNEPWAVSIDGGMSLVVLDSPAEYAVTVQDVELIHVTVSGQGMPGTNGTNAASEEEIMYSKRIDSVGTSVIYRGEAAVGSAETAPVWRISRITLNDEVDVTQEWASGSAAFDKIWTNRATLGYS